MLRPVIWVKIRPAVAPTRQAIPTKAQSRRTILRTKILMMWQVARKKLLLAILQISKERKIMSEQKKELAVEAFDEVVGGAKQVQKKNIKNTNTGTQKVVNQGTNNSMSGNYQGGDGITQQNNINKNIGSVKVGANVNIASAGTGNTYNF
jgi:hypothetical protein